MGVITRASPQLNIFAVGFPITMLLGFLLMWVTLPSVMENFEALLDEGLVFISRLLLITR
jgi:flagellar biosynthetic protein FliR